MVLSARSRKSQQEANRLRLVSRDWRSGWKGADGDLTPDGNIHGHYHPDGNLSILDRFCLITSRTSKSGLDA
jgi:hypothetical protein